MTRTAPDPTSRRTFSGTLRFAYGSVFAQVYLGALLVLCVWAYFASGAGPDASMAGVWPMFATAPVSLVLILLPGETLPIVAGIVVGGLVNAFVLGWCARVLRRGTKDARPSA